ncbi:hypothetical protein [Bifidobacterium tibiigranuli]|jgi:hypothetical protein|uniref:hypothetical protein n=1 Tax=Bifidobacterium tibiigranuli TaxID=2172043 RepID=UPI002354D496|nr:hypothetical protein [Bifidobacterium tibiigranuli]MCH3975281.1 hypothetical protein [Bifidobacterium tibiigranuli]MCI1649989.1 hypothetical protein [Bifidobacterium tibiigranuli]MCI1672808.1 hypothetical protein [Bifidobacterium tibiigranuli]MCI1713647.1 hypothetical protein [Bifidobacterium tibiigranuli]MCI1834309.1 hypothetical protein [Bifidobacterium tibiigranuli]
MRNLDEKPHSGSMLWFMAVLVIVLAAKVDSTVANCVILALAGYAIRTDNASRK